jgi:hypothetical protein
MDVALPANGRRVPELFRDVATSCVTHFVVGRSPVAPIACSVVAASTVPAQVRNLSP